MIVRRLKENSNELYHHGVKGQKWGVRRYQNADGSLTAEGKRRYIKLYNNTFKGDYKKVYEYQKELHSNKPRPKEENIDYFRDRTDKGQQYYKQLAKQLKDGYVTSFIENSKMEVNETPYKTKRGVVVRDKDGNRITSYDYWQAQKLIYKYRKRYITTGKW
jgi:hypothetical protein